MSGLSRVGPFEVSGRKSDPVGFYILGSSWEDPVCDVLLVGLIRFALCEVLDHFGQAPEMVG